MRAIHPADGSCQMGSVEQKNEWTDQIAGRSEASADGGVAQSFPEFIHELLADGRTMRVFICRIQGRETEERAGLGNKNLVLGQVSS